MIIEDADQFEPMSGTCFGDTMAKFKTETVRLWTSVCEVVHHARELGCSKTVNWRVAIHT